jgi:hypothetical protein
MREREKERDEKNNQRNNEVRNERLNNYAELALQRTQQTVDIHTLDVH